MKKKFRPPGEIPPRVPGTTPPKRVGSCHWCLDKSVQESVLELVEDSIVIVIVIEVVVKSIVVVVELTG